MKFPLLRNLLEITKLIVIKTFDIKLRIKDNGEVIELKKREEIEIEWEKGKVHSEQSQKEIVFEKDGKHYPVILKLVLQDYSWWTIGVRSYGFYLSPDASYQIYHNSNPGVEPKTIREEHFISKFFSANKEEPEEYVEIFDHWKKNRVVFFSFFVILVALLITVIVYKRKRK